MIFYDLHVLSFIGLQDLVYLKYVKTEAATGCALWKRVFSKILQNSQENISVKVFFFNKVARLRSAILFKKDSGIVVLL